MYRPTLRLLQSQHLFCRCKISFNKSIAAGVLASERNLFHPSRACNMSNSSADSKATTTPTDGAIEVTKGHKNLRTNAMSQRLFNMRKEKKKNRYKFVGNNYAYMQALGSGGSFGFQPSLIIHSENASYLFNCSEGLQRLCFSNKIKVTRLENVFITHHDWSRVGGIFGLSLTQQDVGLTSLNVYSAPGIEDFFSSVKNFVTFTTGMQAMGQSYRDYADYQDDFIKIHPIPIKATDRKISKLGEEEFNTPQAKRKRTHFTDVIAYICTLPDLQGHLDADKCRDLNVPVGRQLAELKSGKDIVLKDGTVVRSVDVCSPKIIGPRLLVVDCPTEAYIESLVKNYELNTQISGSVLHERRIVAVAHFTPHEITKNSKYRQWMKAFPADCKHLFLSHEESSKVDFFSNLRHQYILNKIDSVIFPEPILPPKAHTLINDQLNENPVRVEIASLETNPFSVSVAEYDKLDNIIKMDLLDKLIIRPQPSFESYESIKRVHYSFEEAKLEPGFNVLLEELNKAQQNLPKAKEYEPELVMLGTGSALPSKNRNTSGILLNFYHPKQASVILDCGEDTYGQLIRMYGQERTNEILRQLKFIYVSHHHVDHHVGLTKLLVERKKLTKERLVLILPPNVDSLLNYCSENFEDLSDSYEKFITSPLKTSPTANLATTSMYRVNKKFLDEKLGDFLEDIKVVGVNHCFNACAVTMRFKINHPDMDTFTVAYSGDCRPNDDFIVIGKNCDLLIHEATFDHKSEVDAINKKHCTSIEAIEVAKKMNAKFTILTHFSQRLAKIPYFTNQFDETIGFAFDNMVLRCPSHFPRLPILKPLLSVAFRKSIQTIEDNRHRADKKQKVYQNLFFKDEE